MTRALVLGGGGSRGAYEIGVWKALRELGVEFSIVTGTSVGALNGAVIAQGDYDLALDIWMNITNEMVLSLDRPLGTETLHDRLERAGVFAREIAVSHGVSSEPLKKLLDEKLDEDRIRHSPIRFGIATFRLSDLSPLSLLVDEIPEGKLSDYVLASASCFPAMQSHKIDGEEYIDGGYADTVPMNLALRAGADEIIAVDLKGIGVHHAPEGLAPENLRMITSLWSLGSFLEFNAESAKRNIALGYLDTMKSYGRLDGRYFAFTPDALEKLRPFTQEAEAEYFRYYPSSFLPNRALQSRLLFTLCRMNGTSGLLNFRRKPSEDELRLNFLENAARVFEVPPTEAYSAESFLAALNTAFENVLSPDASVLEEIMSSEEPLNVKVEQLLKQAERLRPVGVAKWLMESFPDGDIPPYLAGAFSSVFLAFLAMRVLRKA